MLFSENEQEAIKLYVLGEISGIRRELANDWKYPFKGAIRKAGREI
jgi:hypothetical protein